MGDDYVTTIGGPRQAAAPGEPQGCAEARARANDAALPVADRQAAIAYAASLGC